MTTMHDEPWMDAGRSTIYAFLRLQGATTIGQQANAYIGLSNSISDLATFFPEYDYEAGVDSIGEEAECTD